MKTKTRLDRASAASSPGAVVTDEALSAPQEAMSERVQALRLDKGPILERRPRHRLRWLLLVLLLLIAAAAYHRRDRLRERFASFAPTTEFAAVTASEEAPVDIVLNTTGYVVSHSVVHVGSRVPGIIVQLDIEEGDTVEKGQVLAKLDDHQYRAELSHAKASLAAAEAQLAEYRNGAREEDILKARAAVKQAQARRDLMDEEFARAKKLQGSLSQTEFARAKSNALEASAAVDQATYALRLVELGARKERLDALQADVERAKALVEKAQYLFDSTTIISPLKGKVIERKAEVGQALLTETLATSLCRLADFSRLEVEIDIPERDLGEIRLAQPCQLITEAYPDRKYRGQLAWLAPVFNRQRAIRQAKITILDPDDKLAPDMNCQVQVLAQEMPQNPKKVLRLPSAAIDRQGGKAFVYVVQNDKAFRREIQIEQSTPSSRVEVRQGLTQGEIVLLPGNTPVRDGQPVRVRLESAERSG